MFTKVFLWVVSVILEREGVLSNDEWDNGGKTKYGIAQKFHPEVDVQNLTKDGAIQIYFEEYWNACKCGDMPYWAALIVFDAAVQHGVGPAQRFIQEAVGANVDGNVGPKTLACVAKADPDETLGTFQWLRFSHVYFGHEDWKEAKKGWMRRNFIIAYFAGMGPK